MIKKIAFIFLISIFMLRCGFTPIYSEKNNIIESNYTTILKSENSSIVNKAFNSIFKNRNERSDFQLQINIKEENLPIITNTDGTIAKYRIDVSINFILFDMISNKEIYSDYSKGFAQYDKQINNYDTEIKRDEAIMIATINALQLIPIKIQNFQAKRVE